MKKMLFAAIGAALLISFGTAGAQNLSGTYLFAQRDTCDLYFDVYDPAPGSETAVDGVEKPSILFVFGGGFVGGERSNSGYLGWFRLMNENGYRVITVDYRLGLKGKKVSFSPTGLIKTAKNTVKAVEIGVEDLFSAVNYIVANKEALGVDPDNIVLAGSSAGAIISLGAEYFISNGETIAKTLPEGFNFRGVISYAGAIVDDGGTPKYASAPCPTLLFHGIEDRLVQYNKLQVLKLGMWGSNVLAGIYAKNGYNYNIYRFVGHAHDIAANFIALWPYQDEFIRKNVMKGNRSIVDATVDDPSVPVWEAPTRETLY